MDKNTIIRSVLNTLHYSGLGTLGSKFFGGLGAILMLHHVRQMPTNDFAPNGHLTVTPEFLEQLIVALKQEGFTFISMDEMAECLNSKGSTGESAAKVLAITLDDAYRDNLEIAAPVFRKHKAPYTIYTAPGLVSADAHIWWEDLANIVAAQDEISIKWPEFSRKLATKTLNDKNVAFLDMLAFLSTKVDEAAQRQLMNGLAKEYGYDQTFHVKNEVMNWKELEKISNDPLCTIGAHTMQHYAVSRLSDEEARMEMVQSADVLEKRLGSRPKHFAYPYGTPEAAGNRDFDLSRDLGFQTAVTTRHGMLYPDHANHMHALPRISLNGHFQKERFVKTLLSGIPTLMANKGGKLNVS